MRKSEMECFDRYVEIVRMISSNGIRIVCCYPCTNRPIKKERKNKKKWTESDNRALMRVVNVYGVKQWHKVATVTGKSARYSESRWKKGLNKMFADGVKEQILKKYGSENDCNDEVLEEVNDSIDDITSSGGNRTNIEPTQNKSENVCEGALHGKLNNSVDVCKTLTINDQMNTKPTHVVRVNLRCRILSFILFLLLCTLFYNILSVL